MVSLEVLVAALTLVSVLILISNFLITYINYKSASLGDAASREQVMRDRYKNLSNEREHRPNRELEISEPRVRDYGFREWLKALRPGADYPGYTHFNITIRHTNWPSLDKLATSSTRPAFNYPKNSDLRENEKLQQLDVVHVETLREPEREENEKVIISPIITYRIYVDTADPDTIEVLQESIQDIIREMERDREIVEFTEPIKTKDDFEERQKAVESILDDDTERKDDSVRNHEGSEAVNKTNEE
jgi:hypothetical protein